MEQFDVVVESLRTFWNQLGMTMPRVFGALLLLTLGWLLAKLIRKGVLRLLKFLRIDVVAEKSGIEDFLLQGGVRFTTITLLANLVYWGVMFTVVLAVLNSLNLEVAAELFNRVILYIPNVFVAMVVLIFGALFARFIQATIQTYLNNIGVAGSQLLSAIAQYAVLVFVVSIALEQLQIGGQILVSAFQLAFGGLCLAFGLAFGLGGRDFAAHTLDKMLKK
jgi:hypothetical protein